MGMPCGDFVQKSDTPGLGLHPRLDLLLKILPHPNVHSQVPDTRHKGQDETLLIKRPPKLCLLSRGVTDEYSI